MKSVLRIAVVFMLVISTSFGFFYDNAQAGTLDDAYKVLQTVTDKGKSYFCRKGDALKGIYSIRSFNGTLCDNFDGLAALSQYVCTNPEVEGFKSSQCNEKGLKKLNGRDVNTVLEKELKSAPSPIPTLIGKFFP